MSSAENRIGILSWDYLQPKGGMGRSVQWIAATLREGGRTVHVASPRPDTPEDGLLCFTQAGGGHLPFSLLLPFVLGRWIRRRGIGRLLLPVGPGGVFLSVQPSVPVTAVVYHLYAQQAENVPGQSWKKLFVPLERRTLRMADRVLCFCEDTRQALIRYHGIAPGRIILLPHAVDASAWNVPAVMKHRHLCVCVARLGERKGIGVLLRAWPDVMRAVPGARLVIVGRGAQERRVDRAIGTLGGSVTRVASLPRQELARLVAQAAVSACPAYLEGYGLAAAESMCAGTAVVASDCDGLRSLVRHEQTGLLFPAGDSGALAASIIRLMRDPALGARLGADGQAFIRTHTDPAAAARMLNAAVMSGT